ncbi:hypothetical protein BC830DRAFT_1171452 [Chytriomyces sp. MP71]|nr:hypothetical protein BC830DRAFT_1171452 [Chytriomyces sp. MP71]
MPQATDKNNVNSNTRLLRAIRSARTNGNITILNPHLQRTSASNSATHSLSASTYISIDEGGGVRRTALSAPLKLAMERELDYIDLPTRYADHIHCSPPRGRSRVRNEVAKSPSHLQQTRSSLKPPGSPRSRSRTVIILDPKETRLHTLDMMAFTQQEETHVPYSVYPAWWGHEEHIPSTHRGADGRKNKIKHKTDKDSLLSQHVPAKSVAVGTDSPVFLATTLSNQMQRNGVKFIRGGKEMRDVATDTEVNASSSDKAYSSDSDNEDVASTASLFRASDGWIRAEKPEISKWKFPKHQVDESVQVLSSYQRHGFPSNSTQMKDRVSPQRNDPTSKNRASAPSTSQSREASPNSPKRQPRKFEHFNIAVHDLVQPPVKKAKQKSKKHNKKFAGSGISERGEQPRNDSKPPSHAKERVKEKNVRVLDLVYSFLKDDVVMNALDLSVLEDSDEENTQESSILPLLI